MSEIEHVVVTVSMETIRQIVINHARGVLNNYDPKWERGTIVMGLEVTKDVEVSFSPKVEEEPDQ